MSEPIVIRIQWEEGDGEQSHDLRIDVIDEKGYIDVNSLRRWIRCRSYSSGV